MEEEIDNGDRIPLKLKQLAKDLPKSFPWFKDRKTDNFIKLLHLLINKKFKTQDDFKDFFLQFVKEIPQDEVDDFKYVTKEIIKLIQIFEFHIDKMRIPAFRYLLSEGLIDLNRLEDPVYLRLSLNKYLPKDFFERMNVVIQIDEDFIEIAKYAYSKDKPYVGLVLFAVAIEHKLNHLYRDLLKWRGLSEEQITQVIRSTNIHAKIGWLLSISTKVKLPDELRKRLMVLFETRNAVVHYKAIPSKLNEADQLDHIKEKMKEFNFETMSKTLNQVEQFIEEMYEQEIQHYGMAKKVAEIAFGELSYFKNIDIDL